jgi:hypothetical protein
MWLISVEKMKDNFNIETAALFGYREIYLNRLLDPQVKKILNNF